jgi:hypothetical protein
MVDETGPDFVEAIMYRATTGPYRGEYMLSCAKNRCGYLGELVDGFVVTLT